LLADRGVQTPEEMAHARHIYAVCKSQRDALRQTLHKQGIHMGIHYPIPVHLQGDHADLGYRERDFPVSETVARLCCRYQCLQS